MALTNLRVAALAKSAQPGKYTDGLGLFLKITHSGGMYWQWRVRTPRENIVSYGTYPEVSLAEARERHRQAREQRRNGLDPNLEKRKAKLELVQKINQSNTFEVVAREWFAKNKGGWAPAYADRVLGRFVLDVFPRIGKMPISDITALMLIGMLEKIEARGVFETASRILGYCRNVFQYAVITGRCSSDPTRGLEKALHVRPPVKHMPAVTDPERLGQILRMIDGYKGSAVVRAALSLTPILLLRPNELRCGQWTEVNLDAAVWKIPPTRMKRTKEGKQNGTPHIVPLPRQAVEILRELHNLTGHENSPTTWMFPGERKNGRFMSDNTVNAALRALGIDTRLEQTGHGFRATARTLLAEQLGFEDNIIEAEMAHQVKDALGRDYNRTQYLEQRRAMLQTWADHLDKLRGQSENLETVSAFPLIQSFVQTCSVTLKPSSFKFKLPPSQSDQQIPMQHKIFV